MGLPNGVHHLAICTKDIKSQIEFYTQVVGMDLCALYWMHGVDRDLPWLRQDGQQLDRVRSIAGNRGDSVGPGRVASELDGGTGGGWRNAASGAQR